MKATRAYITGIGTTGLLLASAFLSLAVVSAFVAFNGFPGQSVQDPIGTLVVQEKPAPVNVPAKPVHAQALATPRNASVAARRRAEVKRSGRPRASTGPVMRRAAPQTTAPSQPQAPSSSGQSPTPAAGNTSPVPISTTRPSLPGTGTQLPPIPLPQVQVPSPPPPESGGTQQLPIDTSGITGLLSGK